MAIIENTQQDDFSISIAGFGCDNFEEYKSILSSDVDNDLIDNYNRWRQEIEKQRLDYRNRINELESQLSSTKEEFERLHSIEEQENIEWYTKYKRTISVINRDEIELI